MTTEERLTAVAKNVPKVYDSGNAAGYAAGKAEEQAITDAILTRKITEYSNDRVASVGNRAFYDCQKMMKVSLSAATIIGANAFQYNLELIEVNIPAAKVLYSSAFGSCTKLASIDLPVVKSISKDCFFDCSSLVAIILRASDTVCTLQDAEALTDTPIEYGTGYIYVPAALVDSYKAATNWSVYADQIRAIEDYPDITGG